MKEYQERKGLNATTIRMGYRYHGAHLLHQLRKRAQKKNQHDLKLGSLIHEKWLEPDSYEKRYLILPGRFEGSDTSSRRKRAALQSTAGATGKTVLPESLHLQVMSGVGALNKDSLGSKIYESSQKEVSLFWEEKEWGACKARIDLLADNSIIDLKCYHGGRSEADFVSSMGRQALGVQMLWYQQGAIALGREVHQLGHLILDPETHQVRMRWMATNELDFAKKCYLQALEKLDLVRRTYPEDWHKCVSGN